MRPACVGLGLGVPVAVAEARVVGMAVEVVFTDVGRGSPKLTSTQYEFPTCILLQSACMLGFLWKSQYKFFKKLKKANVRNRRIVRM